MKSQLRTLMAGIIVICAQVGATMAVAAPAGPMSPIPGIDNGVTLAQSRACRSCRNYCYNEYRRFCGYSEGCRSAFTACMRDCWYQACR